jgi:hypothetical protein
MNAWLAAKGATSGTRQICVSVERRRDHLVDPNDLL